MAQLKQEHTGKWLKELETYLGGRVVALMCQALSSVPSTEEKKSQCDHIKKTGAQ